MSFTLNPNIDITDSYYLRNTTPQFNFGAGLLLESQDPDNRFFLSYGILFDRNATRKHDLPDNRNVVDQTGFLKEDKIRYYDVVLSYSYLAPVVKVNYEFVEGTSAQVGLSTGVFFKYYLIYKTSYLFNDGKEERKVKGADLPSNHLINSPSFLVGIRYDQKITKTWYSHLGATYSYNLNLKSIVPKHQHQLSLNLGLTRLITSVQ